jgi:transcriptional regulator with XRE-family HTH domain
MDVRLLVGLNFRKLRTMRGLTQEQAAEQTGMSQQYISGLERGHRNPTVLTLHELGSPLGVEPLELLRPFEDGDTDAGE